MNILFQSENYNLSLRKCVKSLLTPLPSSPLYANWECRDINDIDIINSIKHKKLIQHREDPIHNVSASPQNEKEHHTLGKDATYPIPTYMKQHWITTPSMP